MSISFSIVIHRKASVEAGLVYNLRQVRATSTAAEGRRWEALDVSRDACKGALSRAIPVARLDRRLAYKKPRSDRHLQREQSSNEENVALTAHSNYFIFPTSQAPAFQEAHSALKTGRSKIRPHA